MYVDPPDSQMFISGFLVDITEEFLGRLNRG